MNKLNKSYCHSSKASKAHTVFFAFFYSIMLITTHATAQGLLSTATFSDASAPFNKYGHVICNLQNPSGAVTYMTASGSNTAGFESILYLTYTDDSNPNNPIQTNDAEYYDLSADYNKIRPVAITDLNNGDIVLTLQARKTTGETGIVIATANIQSTPTGGSSNGTLSLYQLDVPAGIGELYPMSAVQLGNSLYVSGYATAGVFNGAAGFKHSKQAFIAQIDLNNLLAPATYQFYNTPSVAGYNMDYDAATRLKVFNGNLYVLGACNQVYSFGTGCINSYSWIAQVDANNLNLINTQKFGKPLNAFIPPDMPTGSFAIDFQDENGARLYVLSDLYQKDTVFDTWAISVLDANTLGFMIPNNKTMYYNTYSGFKPYGLLKLPPSTIMSGGGFGVYGIHDSILTPNLDFVKFSGTTFQASFDAFGSDIYSSRYFTFNNVLQQGANFNPTNNIHYMPVGIAVTGDEPFWNTNLSAYSLPQFATNTTFNTGVPGNWNINNPNIYLPYSTLYTNLPQFTTPNTTLPGVVVAAHHRTLQYDNNIGLTIVHEDERGNNYCKVNIFDQSAPAFLNMPAPNPAISFLNTITVAPIVPNTNPILFNNGTPIVDICLVIASDQSFGNMTGYWRQSNHAALLPIADNVTISSIYPTLASDIIHIKATGLTNTDVVTVKIADAMGKTVYTGTALNEGVPTVHLPYLATGFYTATVSVNNTHSQNFKLTIQ